MEESAVASLAEDHGLRALHSPSLILAVRAVKGLPSLVVVGGQVVKKPQIQIELSPFLASTVVRLCQPILGLELLPTVLPWQTKALHHSKYGAAVVEQ